MLRQDEDYMQLALELAAQAEGDTSPNPMVGCVLVAPDGSIVATGYHKRAGAAHAEAAALASAGPAARHTTAYVNLEPCAHYGRTGPCAAALVKAGVARVVAALEDPNPLVAGRGFSYLREHGVTVAVGCLEPQARRLNESFCKWITLKLPFVTLKYAMTLDGKLATYTGDARWITGSAARKEAHRLRRLNDAVLVGIGTVLADDPELSTRLVNGKNPLRIVLDSHLRTPLDAKVLNKAAPTLLVCAKTALERAGLYRALTHVEVLPLEEQAGQLPLAALMQILGARSVTSILVEGGGRVHASFLEAGLADRVAAFIAPKIIGGAAALTPIGGQGLAAMAAAYRLTDVTVAQLDGDLYLTGLLPKQAKEGAL